MSIPVHKRNTGGFTLTELLVAMAVLTVLIAIVLPVTIQGRNRARTARCLSNMRQLGAVLSMYAQDNDGLLPAACGSPFAGGFSTDDCAGGSASTSVLLACHEYIRPGQVFDCPSDHGATAFGFPSEPHGVYSRAKISYLWNTGRNGHAWVVNGALLSTLRPTDTLFQDYGSDWHGVRVRQGLKVVDLSKVNAVFADGHVGPKTSYSLSTQNGQYSASIGGQDGSVDIQVAGGADYGRAYVSGSTDDSEGGQSVRVSGMIYSEEGVFEISRTFTLSGSAGNEVLIRQIVSWIEGQMGG